jgi:DNA-binding transcriptional regulator YhcF (GntR family)
MRTVKAKPTKKYSIADQWGETVGIFKAGFLSVPTRFLRGYALTKPSLSTEEAMFLLQLMTFKWGVDQPYPSLPRIGRMMGVSARTASRYASTLEKKGYLKRVQREGTTNQFDLTGLFERINRMPATRREEQMIRQWRESRSKTEEETTL